jgi:hypothetical protein
MNNALNHTTIYIQAFEVGIFIREKHIQIFRNINSWWLQFSVVDFFCIANFSQRDNFIRKKCDELLKQAIKIVRKLTSTLIPVLKKKVFPAGCSNGVYL